MYDVHEPMLNSVFIMFYHFKGMAGNEEKKRRGPGAKGVELFKEGKYEEATIEFSKFLQTMSEDEDKKVAHYNRGMAHNKLGQHDSALKDAEECLKIDPFWAKGYKCKGLALEGMGRLRDAEETLLDGKKLCSGHDQNTKSVLNELIKRLNRVTGFLGGDLDLFDRKEKEKYCAACDLFEKDMGRSLELDDSKKFISCDKCKMVNYCCQEHRERDRVTHSEACKELLEIRKKSEKDYDIQIILKEDALVLLAMKPRGPKCQQMVNMMKSFDLPPDIKNILNYLGDVQDENLMPLCQLPKLKPITKTQQKELNTWNDLFTILEKTTVIPRMKTDLGNVMFCRTFIEEGQKDIKPTLTNVLTDPMTVFYGMKNFNLFNSGDEDKILRLHVVGAEPDEEMPQIQVYFDVLSNITGCQLHIVFIGPLLLSPPGQVQIVNSAIALFRGTYQDYILTSDYKKPDCIVAFYPGLYDGTYNWLPVVVQAVAKKIPFLVTCNGKEDYDKTKIWLMKGTHMKPEIVQDHLNPFGSWQAVQEVSGSNSVSKRNMYSLVLMGGDLGALRPLLQVEDEKLEFIQVLCRFLPGNSLSDIIKLKKSGKI